MKKFSFKRNLDMPTLMFGVVAGIGLITLVAAITIFINIYASSIEQVTIINSEQTVAQAANTTNRYIEDMESLMEVLELSVFAPQDEWERVVANLLESRPDIVAINLYQEGGTLLGSWSDNIEYKQEALVDLSYFDISNENGDQYLMPLTISKPHVNSLFLNEYPWVVTLSKEIKLSEQEIIQIGIDIQFSEIASCIDEVGIGQHGYCYIVDNEGNIIYHPQQNLIFNDIKEEPTAEISLNSDGSYIREDEIYTLATLDNSEWRIVGVSYIEELVTSRVERMLIIALVIFVMIVFTSFGIGILFARVFSRPAQKLQSAMEDFEKNAQIFKYQSIEGTKEIVRLSDSFGHMVVRIQQLMEKVRKEEISLKKTELNALQSQINPHFLYNTLDSIAWMCEEKRTEEAVEMVNSLARLFRISISRGHELITIENEVKHATSYLKIQNYRYRNQFSYTIEMDEGCKDYLCNKITLQPIIENCIYHGLDRMVDKGEIRIVISATENEIIMVVEDNGVGMSKEQIEDILHKEDNDKAGIGIKNVRDRIRIYFGEQFGLDIESEQDEGTKVIIRMPKIMEGEYDEK